MSCGRVPGPGTRTREAVSPDQRRRPRRTTTRANAQRTTQRTAARCTHGRRDGEGCGVVLLTCGTLEEYRVGSRQAARGDPHAPAAGWAVDSGHARSYDARTPPGVGCVCVLAAGMTSLGRTCPLPRGGCRATRPPPPGPREPRDQHRLWLQPARRTRLNSTDRERCDEAYVPAEHPPPQAAPRLPSPDAHPSRSGDRAPPPRQGPFAVVCLSTQGAYCAAASHPGQAYRGGRGRPSSPPITEAAPRVRPWLSNACVVALMSVVSSRREPARMGAPWWSTPSGAAAAGPPA